MFVMKYQYLMSRIFMARGHDELERWSPFLNDRGQEGWELVSMTADRLEKELADKPAMTEYTLVFKRPA
jgi:hypothetical protein